MQNTQHQNLVGFIWNIANKLRGPYRPPQYRRVMLPLIVLLSSLVGAIIGIILLKIRKENKAFAFGPYIAIAGWIAFIWGEPIMKAYLGQ